MKTKTIEVSEDIEVCICEGCGEQTTSFDDGYNPHEYYKCIVCGKEGCKVCTVVKEFEIILPKHITILPYGCTGSIKLHVHTNCLDNIKPMQLQLQVMKEDEIIETDEERKYRESGFTKCLKCDGHGDSLISNILVKCDECDGKGWVKHTQQRLEI